MGDVVVFVAGEVLALIAAFVIKAAWIVKLFATVNKNIACIWICRQRRGGEQREQHHKAE